ncbi:hypothetical protein ACHAXR_006432 [Thalassiosira sp. AJA248-18]
MASLVTLTFAFLVLSILMAIVTAQDTVVETEKHSTGADASIGILIRLHLIRHGETQANVQNLVLGQGDSPLTDNGVAVARLAAASDMINGKTLRYWRTYCSDLYRAHRTARIVLGLEDQDGNSVDLPDVNLIVEPALRELAKGAREGYLKKLSYEEAMARRRRESEAEIDVPKLESTDEAWKRVKKWIDSIVKDASDHYYSSDETEEDQDNSSCDDGGDIEIDPKIYDVFALSHSALIRTMIHKMVDAELPSDYARTKEGSLTIPNLSRTIIDVRPYKNRDSPRPRWKPSLFRLTDVSHLSDVQTHGPPYL